MISMWDMVYNYPINIIKLKFFILITYIFFRMKFEANHNIFKRAIAEAEFVR